MCNLNALGNPLILAVLIPMAICHDIAKGCRELLHLDGKKKEAPVNYSNYAAKQGLFYKNEINPEPIKHSTTQRTFGYS